MTRVSGWLARLALLLLAASFAAGCGGSKAGPGVTTETVSPPGVPATTSVSKKGSAEDAFLIDDGGSPASAPLSVTFGQTEYSQLEWADWGSSTASAKGKSTAPNCDLNCATGGTVTSDVTLEVSGLTDCGGKKLYTELKIGGGSQRLAGCEALPQVPVPPVDMTKAEQCLRSYGGPAGPRVEVSGSDDLLRTAQDTRARSDDNFLGALNVVFADSDAVFRAYFFHSAEAAQAQADTSTAQGEAKGDLVHVNQTPVLIEDLGTYASVLWVAYDHKPTSEDYTALHDCTEGNDS